MKPVDEVLDNLYRELMGERIEKYTRDLGGGTLEKSIDVYRNAMRAFRTLSKEDQSAIGEFFRLVTVDTASTILGGIDGSTDVGSLKGTFQLEYQGKVISGDLQDGFMNRVERSGLLKKS